MNAIATPVLSEALTAAIDLLCARGDADADLDRFPAALAHYWAAWDLLPEPKFDYEKATWILAAVGDVNFLSGNYEAGRDNLSTVMHCPGAIGIPFLHFRLGQCQYELGNEAEAADELLRALLGGGPALFDDEDPKYLACAELAETTAEAGARRAWRFWKSPR